MVNIVTMSFVSYYEKKGFFSQGMGHRTHLCAFVSAPRV